MIERQRRDHVRKHQLEKNGLDLKMNYDWAYTFWLGSKGVLMLET